jgi:hypothetical protein
MKTCPDVGCSTAPIAEAKAPKDHGVPVIIRGKRTAKIIDHPRRLDRILPSAYGIAVARTSAATCNGIDGETDDP